MTVTGLARPSIGKEAARAPSAIPFLDLAAMHAPLASELDRVWRDVVAASAFIGGHRVQEFEAAWAAYCGVDHAVGVANGTDALVLALRGLGIGSGDEVIVPANTFIATAEAVVLAGATPCFTDADADTLLLTPQLLDAAVTPRTAAVIVVHLFGRLPDMDGLAAAARRHGIAIVEDAAQAHGATHDGRPAGSFGDAACFSFYPGKNLGALGDGGAVVTNSPDLAARVRTMANHGRADGAAHSHHELLGTNSRLDGLQAALLSVKLPALDGWNARRRAAAARYRAGLRGSDVRPVAELPTSVGVEHLFVVRVPNRDTVRLTLHAEGIATGVHYPVPCHLHPPMRGYRSGPLPHVEAAATEILSLPMYPHLTSEQIDRVCGSLRKAAVAC